MKLGWLSDIHLNHADGSIVASFLRTVGKASVDAWLLGGDIGEAPSVVPFLRAIEEATPNTIYFTLGNHDFYNGSFLEVAGEVDTLAHDSKRLIWLTSSEPQLLDHDLALVGDDTWADARYGNPGTPRVEVSDFYKIRELSGLAREDRVTMLNQLGDEAAARLGPKLRAAAEVRQRIIVLIHVPPFAEATWHQGRMSADEWLPWFSCKAVGDILLATAQEFPACRFLAFCGHTHSSGTYKAAPNLRVMTARAQYGVPSIQEIIDTQAVFGNF